MSFYTPPIRDMQFVLHEMLDLAAYKDLPGFNQIDRETVDQILESGGKFASEVLHPLNVVGDKQGCVRNADGSVKTPDGFPEAYQQLVSNGWMLMGAPESMGGAGLPHIISLASNEMVSSANMAFGMYPGLTNGAFNALMAGGSEEQKNLYGPRMASGEWAGTMNLTEPHCGTDLGMMKTKAVLQMDGSYKITGQKIWISGGEQDLTDNIVHLVLARIEDAPEGIKGVSLFVVPKFMVDADGNIGERNAASCGGLEEKMGIHGNATCVMNYDGATGFLLGEENKGMRTMFVMMNQARLEVGLQGLSMASIAYQNAAEFARDRVQGRSLSGPKHPELPADPIIVHPDVRRMLMDVRCFVEGGRALLYYTGLHGDLQHLGDDEETRNKASDYMGLLTPVAKAYLTGRGYQACNDALQVLGGSGFTQEWGMEQFVRDARISMIYEGTNGVQALDLVGRKLAHNGGRAIFSFFKELDDYIDATKGEAGMDEFLSGLETARKQLGDGTNWLMANGMSDFNNAGAASSDFLQVFGLTIYAYMWARMAQTALKAQAAGSDDPFYAEKLITARYFFARVLPEAAVHLVKVETGAGPIMALDAAAF